MTAVPGYCESTLIEADMLQSLTATLVVQAAQRMRRRYRVSEGGPSWKFQAQSYLSTRGAPQPADWEAQAKQGRTTGREFSSAVAAIPTVPGGVPALERATILPSGSDSPPDSLGLVPRARRLPEHGHFRASTRDGPLVKRCLRFYDMKTLSNPYETYTFPKLEFITSSERC